MVPKLPHTNYNTCSEAELAGSTGYWTLHWIHFSNLFSIDESQNTLYDRRGVYWLYINKTGLFLSRLRPCTDIEWRLIIRGSQKCDGNASGMDHYNALQRVVCLRDEKCQIFGTTHVVFTGITISLHVTRHRRTVSNRYRCNWVNHLTAMIEAIYLQNSLDQMV